MAEEKKVLQVGVLMGNVHSKHPMEVLRGIYAGTAGKNVNVTVFPTALGGINAFWDSSHVEGNYDDSRLTEFDYQYNSLYDYTLIAGLDVLIVAFGTVSMFLSAVEKIEFFDKFADIPTIVIQEYDYSKDFTYIIADNYSGINNIVNHLIEKHGKKHILYLSGPHMNTDSVERLRGYYDAMMVHGLHVESRMLAYGDFSSNVEPLIEALLNQNPEADALVCANDEMAITAYNVCRRFGKNIGKEFAITGFDDVEMADKLNPPLTTVRQDGFILGLKAIETAVKGVTNDKNELVLLEAPVMYRGSCGCEYIEEATDAGLIELLDGLAGESDVLFIRDVATGVATECVRSKEDTVAYNIVFSFIYRAVAQLIAIRDLVIDEATAARLKNELDGYITDLLESQGDEKIAWDNLTGYYHKIIDNEVRFNEHDSTGNRLRFEMLEMLHQHVELMLLKNDVLREERTIRRYWDVPIVMQHLKERARDWNGFFNLAMQQIKDAGAASAYLYMVDNPVKRYENDKFVCPKELGLVAEYVDGKINVYKEGQGQRISAEQGFSSLYPDNPGHAYEVFLVFSEDEQYGILICEIAASQVTEMYGVSMQISSGLSYLYLARREEAIKQELYDTLRILREKNKILSSVSSNDPMTGIFNRRGFMEKVLELNRINDDKQACLFFIDLDHLKEINDVFGHNEGDFAISTIAEAVQDMVGVNGCCGRIGGDEFIAMFPCSAHEAAGKAERIKDALRSINATSNKPYYVECSIGYTEYTCSEDVVMDSVISEADGKMYEAKKNRRASIRRDNQK